MWSWARLATFFAAVSIWYPLATWPVPALTASGACAALFVLSVICDRRTAARREAADGLVLVGEEAVRRAGGQVVLIRSRARPSDAAPDESAIPPLLDSGATWPLTEQERDDLDLYGAPVGIFGLLNRTSTLPGARRLRDLIEQPCLQSDAIRARQRIVRWLAEHPAERLRIMAAGTPLRGKDASLVSFARACHDAATIPWRGVSSMMRIWSLLTAAYTGFALVQWWSFGRPRWAMVILWLLALNTLLFRRIQSAAAERVHAWRGTLPAAQACLRLARQAAADLPHETDLRRLRNGFSAVAERSVLPSLCKRLGWTDTGGPMHAFLNMLLFYDLHVAEAILHRVVPHRRSLLEGLSALADLEAWSSLACFAHEQPASCWPTFIGERVLSIEKGWHPLIEPRAAVPNDLRLTPDVHIWVVTGSNMAGKSTFLRTIGLNSVLAQCGTVAMAESMTLCPLRLVSDLQVRDNLPAGESYFLAEVRHVRRMLCPPPGEAPILGLMDEPFRGTNSVEKVAAAMAVVQHLTQLSGFFAVATHELQLTELAANGSAVANYHFREDLSSDGLIFDYRLRPGPAPTRNALRVLEREGYPPAVLESARAQLYDRLGR
jgi:hypothetical protein